MRSVGILLIVSGAYLLYTVLHSRLASQSSSESSSGGGDGGGGSGGHSDGQVDSGTHDALDTSGGVTGIVGSVYTIAKNYGSMSDQEKDDANAFAHANGG